MSIADRPGFAPGLIAGYMAFTNEAGFLGGLIAGFLAGYIALLVRHLLANFPQSLDGLRTILFTPILNILFTGTLMYFLVSPLATVNLGLQNWLGNLFLFPFLSIRMAIIYVTRMIWLLLIDFLLENPCIILILLLLIS